MTIERMFGSNVFCNRDSGALARVRKVDDTFAYIEIIYGSGSGALSTSFSMPVAQYDSEFAEMWRPATAEDLAALGDEGYRPPANTADWAETS